MSQLALPVEVRAEEIVRERSLGGAIDLCIKVAGIDKDKTLARELKVDKAQFSRWLSGVEGIKWQRLVELMDLCGNDAPLLWMLHQRGYDLPSIRRRESEIERDNRLLREEVTALRRALKEPA
jgi:plasmid maintenance system antidote protein VapI